MLPVSNMKWYYSDQYDNTVMADGVSDIIAIKLRL